MIFHDEKGKRETCLKKHAPPSDKRDKSKSDQERRNKYLYVPYHGHILTIT